MAEATQATQDVEHDKDIDQARIMLGLLDSVERDGGQSQRRLASELGIALGLVNAYLKRCVKKGLLKVDQAPARRYVYYLTPQGFAEKSRLTVEYLSYSLRFFRQAKGDCAALLQAARGRGLTRVALAGKSDLAEIAAICALDAGITIVAVVDPEASEGRFVGAPARRVMGGGQRAVRRRGGHRPDVDPQDVRGGAVQVWPGAHARSRPPASASASS